MRVKKSSGNGVFLIELLIVIAIFAVCAAACIRTVGIASEEMQYANRLSEAQIKTADIAESFKGGEDITELEKRYAEVDISIKLSQRTEGTLEYLDITAADSEHTYIELTSVRRVADE